MEYLQACGLELVVTPKVPKSTSTSGHRGGPGSGGPETTDRKNHRSLIDTVDAIEYLQARGLTVSGGHGGPPDAPSREHYRSTMNENNDANELAHLIARSLVGGFEE